YYTSLSCWYSRCVSIMVPTPSSSTLFPYTTLFRSQVGGLVLLQLVVQGGVALGAGLEGVEKVVDDLVEGHGVVQLHQVGVQVLQDRKSTRLNSSHVSISYAVFCLKKKINERTRKVK